jgi:hypothetical protein
MNETAQSPRNHRDTGRSKASRELAACFVTRTGYRRLGVSYALAPATVDFARQRDAHALEG